MGSYGNARGRTWSCVGQGFCELLKLSWDQLTPECYKFSVIVTLMKITKNIQNRKRGENQNGTVEKI